MRDARIVATWALAGALVWFGLALWWMARDLPSVAASVERSVDKLQPIAAGQGWGYSLATRTRLRPACLAAYRARSACSPIW